MILCRPVVSARGCVSRPPTQSMGPRMDLWPLHFSASLWSAGRPGSSFLIHLRRPLPSRTPGTPQPTQTRYISLAQGTGGLYFSASPRRDPPQGLCTVPAPQLARPGERAGPVTLCVSPGLSQDWASSWLPVGVYWGNQRCRWAWRFPPCRGTWKGEFRSRDPASSIPQAPLLAGTDEPWRLRVGPRTLYNRLTKGLWLCAP